MAKKKTKGAAQPQSERSQRQDGAVQQNKKGAQGAQDCK